MFRVVDPQKAETDRLARVESRKLVKRVGEADPGLKSGPATYSPTVKKEESQQE
jgi:hypothetical protein